MAPMYRPLGRLGGVLLLHFLLGAATAGVSAGRGGGTTRCSRVFSFGDSLTDTGNLVLLPAGRGAAGSRLPYGETYFHRPTGRASDGRLIIDFIVDALKVPRLTPYLAGEAAEDFRFGANFAVGGATANDAEFFEGRGIKPFVHPSLSTEMGWFKRVLQLLGSSAQEQRTITASSLLVVGEMGANDYLIAFFQNRTLNEVRTFVPGIIDAVRSSVTELFEVGARTVVVQGMLPLGCEPRLLELFKHGNRADDYDKSGCLTSLNELAEQHNRALNGVLDELRQAHPSTAIIYADLYRAITDIIVSPRKHGFGDSPLFACCGAAAAARTTRTSRRGATRKVRRHAPTRRSTFLGTGSTTRRLHIEQLLVAFWKDHMPCPQYCRWVDTPLHSKRKIAQNVTRRKKAHYRAEEDQTAWLERD